MSESEAIALSTLFNIVAGTAFVAGACIAVLLIFVAFWAFEFRAGRKYYQLWKRRAQSVETGTGFRVIK